LKDQGSRLGQRWFARPAILQRQNLVVRVRAGGVIDRERNQMMEALLVQQYRFRQQMDCVFGLDRDENEHE
jgi:hypothetical protein